jgi:hypothetical protein
MIIGLGRVQERVEIRPAGPYRGYEVFASHGHILYSSNMTAGAKHRGARTKPRRRLAEFDLELGRGLSRVWCRYPELIPPSRSARKATVRPE